MNKAKSELVMLYEYTKNALNEKKLHISIVKNKNLDLTDYRFVEMQGEMEVWHQMRDKK
jgi:hypothetical protein